MKDSRRNLLLTCIRVGLEDGDARPSDILYLLMDVVPREAGTLIRTAWETARDWEQKQSKGEASDGQ